MEENLKQQNTSIIKIAIYGPESTGKTTLSKELAIHFDTVWAPEYARDYLEKKLIKTNKNCEPEDLMPIAIGQTNIENEALLTANKYLFCDTCLLTTKVFSEIHYNFCDPVIDKAARKHKYDLFLLTDIDVSWEYDSIRDGQENRAETFEIFKKTLIENEKPFVIISGNLKARLEKVKTIIEDLEKAAKMGFSSHDFVQVYDKGISLDAIKVQLDTFRIGIPLINLVKPATLNDGILKLTKLELQEYLNYFEVDKPFLKLMKFVPASGAASRMFKFLNEFLNEFDFNNESINAYINRRNANNLSVFFAGLEKFPFYETINLILKELYPNFSSWENDKKKYYFVKILLGEDYFNFSNKPKATLPFHSYSTHTATPIEEHLNESVFYASSNGFANLHFTISKIHQDQFEKIIKSEIDKVEKKASTKINIAFSFQNSSTDTIAVDLFNIPFRNENQKLVFRPAGHGALIENLNQLDADIIFIKNIDNVIQNNIENISFYKKSLAGILITIQKQIFIYLQQIENKEVQEKNIENIISFIINKLNTTIIDDFYKYTIENKVNYIFEVLNRPIRVCGMVKNEGEPGGGPFWVRDLKGNLTLQIIESTQIDHNNSSQLQIFKNATHFNPVNLVCGIKDFKGNKFNLNQFVDSNCGFIVEKNKNGKDIKAFELPGLWNGAMSNWITLFVEVPLSTFNPVKTVNDLLKSAHQPQ